jgi:hypothetical protein
MLVVNFKVITQYYLEGLGKSRRIFVMLAKIRT